MAAISTESISLPELPSHQYEHVITSNKDSELTFQGQRVIVLPVDHSEASRYTINWLLTNFGLRKESDQIILIHCRPFTTPSLPSPYNPYAFIMDERLEELERSNRKKAHSLLQKLAQEFIKEEIHVRAIALIGDTRSALEEKIKQLAPTCVVMGNRGLGPVSRVFLGSVSSYLVHHAPAPIMIIPFPPSAAKK